MDKNIITFQANEQELINTTPEVFASDTVSYIEARFELGQNWGGFDSVRAIWSNGYERISTVLDSLGVCIVPTEVLTRRADVLMNLVGSISDNGELTDRLTTFPVIALRVTKKAMVEGTETAPITPSQFEQFASAVRQDADRAEAGASEAEGYRDEALQIKTDVQGLKADVEGLKSDTEQLKDDTASIKADVQAIADGFDDTVADAVEEITTLADTKEGEITSLGDDKKTEISSLANDKKAEITAEGTTQKGLVSAEGTSQLNAIRTEGSSQLSAIRTEGATQKGLVTTEGQTQVGNVQAEGQTQIDAIQTEGEEQIQAIEDKGQEVISLIPYMAPVIVDTASGDIASFTDGADDYPIKSLKVSLEPIQSGSGDPSPTNIRPISGWSGVNVYRMGKNLCGAFELGSLSESKPIGSTYAQVMSVSSLKRARTVNPIPTKNQVITISADWSNYLVCLAAFDENCLYLGQTKGFRGWGTQTFTINWANAYYIGLAVKRADEGTMTEADFTNCKLQVEFGSTATAYEPYQGSTYPISLPSTVYGGEVSVIDGNGKVTWGIVDLGSLNWTYASGLFEAVIPLRKDRDTQSMCSQYDYYGTTYYSTLVSNLADKQYGFTSHSSRRYIEVKDSAYTSASDFKTAMNGVQVCFDLETPTDLTTTPTEIRSLKGSNNIWSNGEVEVEYCADTKLYIDKKLG